MSRRRPESDFLSAFSKAWRAAGGHWVKIPDAGGPMARFGVLRPYDVHAAIGGQFFTIEAKHISRKRFSTKDMRPHQIPALDEAARHGYHAYVLVCYGAQKNAVAEFFHIDTVKAYDESGVHIIESSEADIRFIRKSGVWQSHGSLKRTQGNGLSLNGSATRTLRSFRQ